MPTLKTHTLGCKVNQYETELVRQGLASVGYEEALRASSRSVRRQHMHGDERRGREESPGDSQIGSRESRFEHCRDGLLRDTIPRRIGSFAQRHGSRHRQTRDSRPARPLWCRRSAQRNQPFRPPSQGLCQSPGWLPAQMQLLHHSPRSTGNAQSSITGRGRRGEATDR